MNIQPATAALAQAQAQAVGGSPPRPEATTDQIRDANRVVAPEKSEKASDRPEREASRDEVAQAAKSVEKFVDSFASQLQFSVDESSGVRVVKVVDRSTSEVIRQIPSEEMLQIAQALDRLQGLLVRQKA